MLSLSHSALCKVDPRACGVNLLLDIGRELEEGRSPRMRGKLVVSAPVSFTQRSIPAHAG